MCEIDSECAMGMCRGNAALHSIITCIIVTFSLPPSHLSSVFELVLNLFDVAFPSKNMAVCTTDVI